MWLVNDNKSGDPHTHMGVFVKWNHYRFPTTRQSHWQRQKEQLWHPRGKIKRVGSSNPLPFLWFQTRIFACLSVETERIHASFKQLVGQRFYDHWQYMAIIWDIVHSNSLCLLFRQWLTFQQTPKPSPTKKLVLRPRRFQRVAYVKPPAYNAMSI